MIKRAAIVDGNTGEIKNIVIIDDEKIPSHLTDGENIELVIDEEANFTDIFSPEEKTLSRPVLSEVESDA